MRQFLSSDHALAQLTKSAIGTITGLVAVVSPRLEEIEAWARTIGAVAAAFCSVVMALGVIAGGIRWLSRRLRRHRLTRDPS